RMRIREIKYASQSYLRLHGGSGTDGSLRSLEQALAQNPHEVVSYKLLPRRRTSRGASCSSAIAGFQSAEKAVSAPVNIALVIEQRLIVRSSRFTPTLVLEGIVYPATEFSDAANRQKGDDWPSFFFGMTA